MRDRLRLLIALPDRRPDCPGREFRQRHLDAVFRWQVLADPDGNELCVVGPPAECWQA